MQRTEAVVRALVVAILLVGCLPQAVAQAPQTSEPAAPSAQAPRASGPTVVPAPRTTQPRILYRTAEGDQYSLWSINADGSGKRLAVSGGKSEGAQLRYGNSVRAKGLLEFLADADGRGRLLYIDLNGNSVELGSGFPAGDYWASMSSSGKVLALVGRQGGTGGDIEAMRGTLYFIHPDGSGTRALPDVVVLGAQPCNDDASAIIARIAGQGTDYASYTLSVELQGLDGSSPRQLGAWPATESSVLAISPDCDRIWVTSGWGLYLVDGSGNQRRVLENVVSGATLMSPDYRHVVYTEWPLPGGEVLHLADSDGARDVVLSSGDTIQIPSIEPTFLHDGAQLAFMITDKSAGRESLYIIDADGSNKQELLSVPLRLDSDGSPKTGLWWAETSPKANWIVLRYNQSDDTQVYYVLGYDGARFELPIGAGGGDFSPGDTYYTYILDDRWYLGDAATQAWRQFFDVAATGERISSWRVTFSPDEQLFAFNTFRDGDPSDFIYVGISSTGEVNKIPALGIVEGWLNP